MLLCGVGAFGDGRRGQVGAVVVELGDPAGVVGDRLEPAGLGPGQLNPRVQDRLRQAAGGNELLGPAQQVANGAGVVLQLKLSAARVFDFGDPVWADLAGQEEDVHALISERRAETRDRTAQLVLVGERVAVAVLDDCW